MKLFRLIVLTSFFFSSINCSGLVTLKRSNYFGIEKGAELIVALNNGEIYQGKVRDISESVLVLAYKKGTFKHIRIEMEPFDRRNIEKGEVVTVNFKDDVQVEGRVRKIELGHITLSDYLELRRIRWEDINSITEKESRTGRKIFLTTAISAVIIVGAVFFIKSGFKDQ